MSALHSSIWSLNAKKSINQSLKFKILKPAPSLNRQTSRLWTDGRNTDFHQEIMGSPPWPSSGQVIHIVHRPSAQAKTTSSSVDILRSTGGWLTWTQYNEKPFGNCRQTRRRNTKQYLNSYKTASGNGFVSVDKAKLQLYLLTTSSTITSCTASSN